MTNKLWDRKQLAFQEAIKEIRGKSELRQVELAEKLGKHQSYVSKYERGERKLDYLEVVEVLEACGSGIEEFQAVYNSKRR
ncbi:MAG: hypothetical protein DHS20C12_27130 [Pseudohongiella sp.]|nr:MAG: hypothetical protein DHS20C12_27130 [Pseudohongiella sp.]